MHDPTVDSPGGSRYSFALCRRFLRAAAATAVTDVVDW
jgi:hypothetical protein